jgi:hypothetical protein
MARMTRHLLTNPRSDQAFVALVAELGLNAVDAASLEAALRAQYPKVRVRERVLSAEQIVTWYVYKEGRWIPSD